MSGFANPPPFLPGIGNDSNGLGLTCTNLNEAFLSTIGVIADVAGLRGLSAEILGWTQVIVQGYYSKGDGGEGFFWYNSADTTSADNGGTIIEDAAGRRWYRLTGGLSFSVKWFGATGAGGSSDDTGAIQAALNATGQGQVFFPPGTYNYTSLTIPSGVSMFAGDLLTTVLQCTSPTGQINVVSASTIEGFTFLSSVATIGAAILSLQGNNITVQSCQFVGYFLGIQVGTIASVLAIDAKVLDCAFRNPAIGAGSGAIYLANYGNAILDNLVITGPTSGQQPDFGIRADNGDTLVLNDSNITHHGYAFLSETAAGLNIFATLASNCLFDSPGTISGSADASGLGFVGAGNVEDAQFSNCWFGLSAGGSGAFINPTGSGTVQGVDFTGCKFVGNAINGLQANGAGVSNITVTGGDSTGNVGGAGLNFGGGATAFTVTGHRAGNTDSRGPNLYGIVTSGAGNNYVITGNNLHGNTTAAISDAATGSNKLVTNNLAT